MNRISFPSSFCFTTFHSHVLFLEASLATLLPLCLLLFFLFVAWALSFLGSSPSCHHVIFSLSLFVSILRKPRTSLLRLTPGRPIQGERCTMHSSLWIDGSRRMAQIMYELLLFDALPHVVFLLLITLLPLMLLLFFFLFHLSYSLLSSRFCVFLCMFLSFRSTLTTKQLNRFLLQCSIRLRMSPSLTMLTLKWNGSFARIIGQSYKWRGRSENNFTCESTVLTFSSHCTSGRLCLFISLMSHRSSLCHASLFFHLSFSLLAIHVGFSFSVERREERERKSFTVRIRRGNAVRRTASFILSFPPP